MAVQGTTIIILEDHPMMRDTLGALLVSRSGDTEVLYSGASTEEALAAAAGTSVDCVILDLDLGDGRAFTEHLVELEALGAPILVVSATASPRAVQAAMARGAKGYVSKQSTSEEFVEALEAVLTGNVFLSRDLAAMLASDSSQVSLSPQEQRALLLYSSGMKLDAVARTMQVSPGTVKEYIKRVRAKYAAAGTPLPTKIELFQVAREEGLV